MLATELLRALAREEDRRRGGQVGWAAQVGCTVLGCGWLPGKLQVRFLSSVFYLFLFCFVLFYLIATEFKFKQI